MTRLIVLAALLAASAASAQAPRTISFQGVLEDNGAPVTTATDITFSLFSINLGGTAVWSDTQTVTPDATGAFSADLDVLDTSLFRSTLYLEVEANGTMLGPRTRLAATPYALALYGVRVTPPASCCSDAPSIVAGHPSNSATGTGAVVAGGGLNTNTPGGTLPNRASGDYATVSGGRGNTASGLRSTIGGGSSNTASGGRSTVPGGGGNHARGDYSFAAGYFARAVHDGTFVWSDDSQTSADSLVSTGPDQFLIRAAGGVGIGTDAPSSGQLAVFNTGTAGYGSTTVRADNAGTGNAVAGYFTSAGTAATLVAENFSSGDLLRAFASGDLRFRVFNDGNVRADGSFTGNGADFAEYFPLAPAASVAPGDLVGLRGGAVSLAASGADQVMIASSDPAFVGNPDAAEGGALVALVGQAEVRLHGTASVGDLLVASGRDDGTARAVAPALYDPEADGPVAGRVLSVPEAGVAVALVGVDEAAALRSVVARQAAQIEALRADRDRQRATLDAVLARLARLEGGSPSALLPSPR